MTKRTYLSAGSIALAAALLAGCGGGGSTPPAKTTPTGAAKTGTVAMTINLNSKMSVAVKGSRRPKYVSYSTRGFEVSWETYNGGSDNFGHTQLCIGNPTAPGCGALASNFVGTVGSGIVSQNITCTTAGSDGAYSCTIIIPAPAGYDDFQLSLWDQPPASTGTGNGFGGSFNVTAGGANMLSYALVMDQQVLGATTNPFNIALHGVVRSMTLQLAPGTLVVGAAAPGTSLNPTAPTLNFFALDADGNIIKGFDTYVNLNGYPVTINIAQTPNYPAPTVGAAAVMTLNQPGSSTANSCLGLAPNGGLKNPQNSACTVLYNGGDILADAYSGTAVSSGDPSPPSIPISGASLNFTRSTNGPILVPGVPPLNTLALPTGNNVFLAPGRDGNMYVSSQNDAIYQISTGATPAVTTTFVPPGPGNVDGITQGPDNQIWYADYSSSKVGALNLQTGSFMPTIATSGNPNNIVTGPDNNMWFTEGGASPNSKVATIQILAGTQTTPPTYHILEYTLPGAQINPDQIAVGSDGFLWFTVPGSNVLDSVNPATGLITTCGTVLNIPSGVTSGSATDVDGSGHVHLYVSENGARQIDQFSVVNGNCVFVQKWSTSLSPFHMTLGPDGSVYATESNGTISAVARVSVSGILTEYPYSSAGFLYTLATGPDNRIWVSDLTAPLVHYFTP